MASNLTEMASTFPLFRKILAPQLVAGVTRNVSYSLQHNGFDVGATGVGMTKLEDEPLKCMEPSRLYAATNTVRPKGGDLRGRSSVACRQLGRFTAMDPQKEETEPFDSEDQLVAVGFGPVEPSPLLIFIGGLGTSPVSMKNEVKIEVHPRQEANFCVWINQAS